MKALRVRFDADSVWGVADVDAALVLRPIGHVESALRELADAPRQGDEGAPDATIVLDPAVLEGVRGLAGVRITVTGLEAIDGTPVVDIKPVLGPVAER